MNKIYKLIWSKVKNMWVVASELAKSHTKSPNSGIVGSVSLASLESKINMNLSKGFVAGVFPMATLPAVKSSSFTITVAAIVKNEAENVPTWVQAARSCADEIVVVDTGSTDDTVKRFADYGIKCFYYDWHDDFASAKNYMISLCHGDWIVLLDGDEWFRDGCDVRKAIAKHHGNPIIKAIIADWICLDKDRDNAVMFSGGAVRAFRNQPDVRYFRKVHENLTINYENFAFEPEFKMYHTGYSGSVNRSKHERNLRIMRTMFDFDNGEVEFPTDWRYIEDTYAGLGQFDKALWAADKMISYGVQEYSAAAWITKFNVLFAMKTSLEEMKKQFAYCFKTVPSVSGFRFLASVYFFRNGLIAAGLDNYIEGLRMLMGPQDKVAQEHTYWRMYMPEASALASAVYLQNKQVEAALYACKVCEQYCGQTDWTNRTLADVRRVMNQSEESLLGNIAERVLPVLQFGKKAVLATALASSLTVGMVGNINPVFAACCNLNGVTTNKVTGSNSTVTGGQCNTSSGCYTSVVGGCNNTAGFYYSYIKNSVSRYKEYGDDGLPSFVLPEPIFVSPACADIVGDKIRVRNYVGTIDEFNYDTYNGNYATVSGGCNNVAIGDYSSVSGGCCNIASGCTSSISGGVSNVTLGEGSFVAGGSANWSSGCYSSVLGGGSNTSLGYASTVVGGMCNASHGENASVLGGAYNLACAWNSSIVGGCENLVNGDFSVVVSGNCNVTIGESASVFGGITNTADGTSSVIAGGECNQTNALASFVAGGFENIASACYASVVGGCSGVANACYSTSIGGGITGSASCSDTALGSVAIGKGAVTTRDYEVSVGSACASVALGGNMNVIGTNTVTDGTTTKSWSDILNAGGSSGGSISYVGVNSTGNENKDGSGASGTDAIAIGKGAVASGNQSVSIGTGNQVRGNHSGAIGDPNIVDGSDSYVVGNNSTVRANVRSAFVLGNNTTVDNGLPANWDTMSDEEKAAWANGLASTDIMEGAVALGSNISVSLDNKAATSRTSSGDPAIKHVVALGDNVVIGEENAVGIGHTATATALNALAIGDDAQAVAEGANAIGHSSRATNRFANASGYQAQATGEGAGAFGQDAQATANFATAFGRSTRASAESATAIGNTAHAVTQSSIAIGSSAVANGGANTNAVAIGRGATVGSDTQGYGEAVALGGGSSVQNAYGTALGSSASVSGQKGTAVGYNASVTAANAIALGADSVADTADTVSVGVAGATRKIVNVTNGSADTDVSTVGQTGNDLDLFGSTLSLKNANGTVLDSVTLPEAPVYTAGDGLQLTGTEFKAMAGDHVSVTDNGINVLVDGTVAENDTGLVSGGDVYTAVNTEKTTRENADTALGTRIDNMVKNLSVSGNSLTVVKGDDSSSVLSLPNSVHYIGFNGGDSSSANYNGQGATGSQSMAIGQNAHALSTGAIAIGDCAFASGFNRPYSDDFSVSIGACAYSYAGIALGSTAHADGGIAIGNTAKVEAGSEDWSSITSYNGGIAIGSGSKAVVNNVLHLDAMAIGRDSYADWDGVAIGYDAHATFGTSIGNCSYSNYSISIGAAKSNIYGIAIGANAVATDKGVSIGHGSYSIGDVVSFGHKKGDPSALTGSATFDTVLTRRLINVTEGIDGSDAATVSQLPHYIGVQKYAPDANDPTANNYLGGGALGSKSIAIGYNAQAPAVTHPTSNTTLNHSNNIAIGTDSYALTDSVAIGNCANSNSDSVAIGKNAQSAYNSIAIGSCAQAEGDNSIALGHDVLVQSGDGVIIGGCGNSVFGEALSSPAVIIGGKDNFINDSYAGSGVHGYNTVIGSYCSYMVGSSFSSITGGCNNSVGTSSDNHIIGSNNTISTISDSNILIGRGNYIGDSDGTNPGRGVVVGDSNSTGVSNSVGYIFGRSNSVGNEDDVGYVFGNLNDISTESYYVTRALVFGRKNVVNAESSNADDFAVVVGNCNTIDGGNHLELHGSSNYIGSDVSNSSVFGSSNEFDYSSHVSVYGSNNEFVPQDSVYLNNVSIYGNTNTFDGDNENVSVFGNANSVTQNVRNSQIVGSCNIVDSDSSSTYIVGICNTVNGGCSTTVMGFCNTVNSNYDALVIGNNNTLRDSGGDSIIIGNCNSLGTTWGHETTQIIAIGYGSDAQADYSTAINGTVTENAVSGIAVYGTVSAHDGIAVGDSSSVSGHSSVAIGYEAQTSHDNSVALGSTSVTHDDNTVSFGHSATDKDHYDDEYGSVLTRRLTFVSAGVNDTDAVNVKQLNDGLYDKANWDASNIGRNLPVADGDYPDGLTDEQKAEYASNLREYNLRSWGQALGAGTVTGGDARLITGDTLHVEVRPANSGTYVKTNNTTGQNLLALDQQLSTVLEGNATQNTAISDLQNEMETKANVGLDNITDAGKTVVRDLAKESVKVVNGTNTTVTEGTDGNAKTYAVNAVTDGAVADGNTGIVTGGTVYSAIQDMIASSGSSEGKANVALDNVTEAGHTVIKTDAKSAVNVAGNSDVTVTKTDVDGVDTYNVAVVKTGTVSDGNEGIVTGDTVYDALRAEARPSADGNYITAGNTAGANLTALDTQVKTNADAIASVTDGMDGKANTSLDNVTSAGQDVIRTLAKGSVKVADGTHTTVTEGTDGDAKTYVVNVFADGLVADGDTGIVTGGAVYNALQTQASDTVTALDTKANKDASNVTDAEAWGTKIATGSVAENDVKAVSGDTVYRMKTVLESAVSDGLDGKANIGLDNISTAGEGVVKDLAKGSVNVVGGVYATVDKSDVNGVDTYTVNVDTSGAVTDGDTKLVTGGVVYNALQTQASDIATALDTKANKDASNVTDAEAWGTKIATGLVAENDVRAISGDTAYRMKTALETAMNTGLDSKADNDLSNLTDAGQAVIQQKAISSVKVGDGDNTTVSSETDADGNIIYKVKANATGTVAANDTGLVDGGTVYEALENTKSEMTGNISGKADKDLGNITDDGKEVVKDLAKDSVSVESGTNAEVVKTDVNGVDTYTVNVAGNGQVSENDTGLVNGGTMYNELRPVDGNYVRKDVTTAANLSALDTKIGSVSDGTFVRSANTVGQNLNALDEALYDKANKDASNIGRNLSIADHEYPDGLTAEQKAEYASNQREYNLRSWGQALGAGTVTGGDSRLITGDTLHVEVRPANSGTYVRVDKTTGENLLALDEQLSSVVNGSSAQSTAISDLENEMANKANIALDNINADGVNVVRNIAKSAVVVADGPNTTVSSSTDTDGNITYHVTANATGSVADGNTGLVDGGMVYTAIENAKGSMGGDIGGLDADGNYIRKANTVAQNLVALDTQVRTNADGLVAEQTAREMADTALRNRIGTLTADGNYIAKDSSVSENLSRLDTAVKTAGDTADANAAAIADLKDLSNITAAGETVIKDLAKGSVKVINGTNTTVTEGMDGDVKTFAVNVASNGAVADGDTGLVSGGTVKSALDALSGSVDAGLAGKANVSLDNLDADGHTVIKSDAKSAVNVVGSNRATVTKTDVNGVDTYMVDVKADGEILADNKGLVDGGMVFDAVAAVTGNIIDYTNDGLAGKANVELDNLAATGHAVIKSDAKSAVNVTGGQYATVTKTDVDGIDTYMVNVATDGSVTDGNEKLVTGGTVYDALQGIRGSVDTAMAGKVNTSLDNLDVAGVGRVRDIAKTAVSVANGAHTTASSETDADGNVTYRVNVDLDGSVASGNNGVVSGGGIYNELRPADGNYVAQSNTTAANLTALDVAVKEAMTKAETAQAAAGGNVVLYDGNDKSAVTLGGTDGTVIHNVADGAVSADSKDAVNGGQLYTVKSAVDTNTTAIAGLDTKIQDNATAIVGLDTRVQDNATAIAGLDTRVQDNATAIAGLDTRVQDNATAIDTLRTTVTDDLNGKADTDLGNLSDTGKGTVRDLAKESVRVADGVNTTVRTTVDGNASVYHVDVATTGRVESGNAGIVTGDAVYEALRDLELNASDTHYVSVNPSERDDETYTNHGASGADAVAIGAKSYARGDESVAIGHNNDVSGNETYVIGSDVNATGNHSVVLGKGSDGSLDNVVSVGSAGNERRIVHVADGELSADSKDAVNGKQLYEVREKLQNAEGIDVDKWSDALGTGSVAPDDDRLVKGSTVYSAIQSFSGITLSPDGSTLHVGTNNTATVVDFSNSEGNGRVLQGVVTDPDNPNSAANVGYVNAVGQNIIHGVNNSLNRMDTRIDKVGAGAAALASLEPMPFDDDQKWSISAAIGTYHGTQAGAVGVFYKPQDNVMLNIRGAVGNGENMGGAGLSIGLNKGAAKGLSKASMAKAMNAQANEIVAQKQLIQNQQAQLDAQKAEIEELKQMVRSVVASKQVTK